MSYLNKSILSGFSKASCPAYKIFLNETKSPRGLMILAEKNIPDKGFYDYCTCGACEINGPINKISLDEEIIMIRERLVEEGMTTEANLKMIDNIKEKGNPLGLLKNGEIPEEIWDC